jgi:hypothetical protein
MTKSHRIYLLLGVLLCCLGLSIHAQTYKNLIVQAEAAMANKDYQGAALYYNRAMYRDSNQANVQYAYAEASRLNYDFDVAFYWYNKILSRDNSKRYPLCTYYLGQILKTKSNYKEAKKWFTKFAKGKKNKTLEKEGWYLKGQKEIEACDLSLYMLNNAVPLSMEHLDTTINSKVSEYAAVEKDSTLLYFSSLRDGKRRDINDVSYNKIYTANLQGEKLKRGKELDTNFNSANLHAANTCFNTDNTRMIISKCQAKNASEYTCELYESKYLVNHWSRPEKLPAPINQAGTTSSQPCFGKLNGQSVLFFASNRANGQGGMDIWYSRIQEGGEFGTPINAGKNINTSEDEITPWFSEKDSSLFFSSTYHKGMGGFDIFTSIIKKDSFLLPSNAGFPINSSFNDVYFSKNKQGTRAYLSSNRKGSYFESKHNCCNDIYRFRIKPEDPPFKFDSIQFAKNQMKVLVPLTLFFHNDEPDAKTTATLTTKNYQKTYEDYTALKPQYLYEFPKGREGEEKDLATNKIENFFADSVDAGMQDLEKFAILLEQVLLKGEKVTITMKGYCSPLASTSYNVNLAKRRISSLRNYFIAYKGGVFMKYIDNQNPNEGRITFEDVDIGELTASKVSDDVKDIKNSVYSPYAAAERKIQIIAVSFLE